MPYLCQNRTDWDLFYGCNRVSFLRGITIFELVRTVLFLVKSFFSLVISKVLVLCLFWQKIKFERYPLRSLFQMSEMGVWALFIPSGG